MRNLIILVLLVASVSSCMEDKVLDLRAPDLRRLIKKTEELNISVSSAANEIIKDERIDSGKKDLASFIQDSLKNSFKDWEAEVLSINNHPLGFDGVKIELMIVKHLEDRKEKYPQYSSIILSEFVPRPSKLINEIKKLIIGAKILVTGKLINDSDKLKFDNYSSSPSGDEIFNNPEFDVQISNIKLDKK